MQEDNIKMVDHTYSCTCVLLKKILLPITFDSGEETI